MAEEMKDTQAEETETVDQEQVDTQEPTVSVSELQRRLDKQQQKFEQQLKEAIEKERSYAEMSEKEKQKAQLDARIEALDQREAEIAKKELQAEVKADIQEKGLPTELSEILVQVGDKEAILEAVNLVKKYVDEAVNEGIKASTRQNPPSEPTRDYGGEKSQPSFATFANENRIIKN